MNRVHLGIQKRALFGSLLAVFLSLPAFSQERPVSERTPLPLGEIAPLSPALEDVSFHADFSSLPNFSQGVSAPIPALIPAVSPKDAGERKEKDLFLPKPSENTTLAEKVTSPSAALKSLPSGGLDRETGLFSLKRKKPKIDFDGAQTPASQQGDLEAWVSQEEGVALKRMLLNISPAGEAKGAVAASPSRENPDYWYHWVRDAGLTMNAVATLYQNERNHSRKRLYLKMMKDYARFSRANQLAPTLSGIGEPKFNMDGTPFNGPWGRPQDDGPAIRAIALIRFAKTLISEGQGGLARKLYDGKLPTSSVIKTDLEYVSHFWRQTSYDLWEEVKGHHFYTQMLQRKALLSGAELARMMKDPGAADFYEQQAALLKPEIERHWDEEKGIIVQTLDQDAGLNYKKSGMDAGVILAILQGAFEDGFFSALDDRALSTVVKMAEVFKNLYPINRKADAPGIGIGRYPEDRYFGGNPWVISTNTFGQFYLRLAEGYAAQGFILITDRNLAFFKNLDFAGKENLRPGLKIESASPLFDPILSALRQEGNRYLETVRRYANPDGSMSEQIDKETGAMISARDLTWNYVSFLREACEGRACLLNSFPKKPKNP